MRRIKQMLAEAVVQEQHGRREIAYFRYLASVFGTVVIMSKLFVFQPSALSHTLDRKAVFQKMKQIIRGCILKASELLDSVVDCQETDLESFKNSGTQIAGQGSEPLVVDTCEMFEHYPELVQRCENFGDGESEFGSNNQSLPMETVNQDIVPRLPESHLRLSYLALLYHAQLLMQKLGELEERTGKAQANAIFIACCNRTCSDLIKIMERCLEVENDMKNVEELVLRNELLTVDKIANELYLVDKLLWSRLATKDLLSSRLIPIETVKAITDYTLFISIFTSNCIFDEKSDVRASAETIVFLVRMAERLIEKHGDYNAASAIIQTMSSGKLFDGKRDSVHLLPNEVLALIERLKKITNAEDGYLHCRDRILKHPHPIPPIHLVLNDVRRAHVIGLAKETEKLVGRVVNYCKTKGFGSPRPDIQHWLLTRSCGISNHIRRIEHDNQIGQDNEESNLFHTSPPKSSLIDDIDNDRFDIVFGTHART